MARTETPMTRPALVILRRQLAKAREDRNQCANRAFREMEEYKRISREAEAFRISAETSAAAQAEHEFTARELEIAIEALTGDTE